MDSASPSGQSNGPTPQAQPLRKMRRPAAAPSDPLRPRKKPVVRRSNNNPTKTSSIARPANIPSARGTPVFKAPTNGFSDAANGGWSQVPQGPYIDYPLVISAKEIREGLRHHVARFASKNSVDPRDQEQFTRPVMLQRRRPNDPKFTRATDVGLSEATDLESKEREKLEILKAERDARKAADQAQIAPVGKSVAQKKPQADKQEKTVENFIKDKTPAQMKEARLRFEESYAWYFDDHDGKNQWMGIYEAALSECQVAIVVDGSNFKIVPIEKWYKFVSKGTGAPMTVDEVEAVMNKKVKENRWTLREQQDAAKRIEAHESRQMLSGLYTVKKENARALKVEKGDADGLDFDADDLFQDDDETMHYHPEKNEEEEEAKARIKEDQLGANLFNMRDEKEVDQEEQEAKLRDELLKVAMRKTKKALRKREKNFLYDDDSDYNASDSDSSDDTSDEEKQKELEKKRAEEEKMKSKSGSGATSKGNTTPSGRPKHIDPLQKTSKGVKRAASPNHSESSGNESTRKKAKKKHGKDSLASGASTPRTDQAGFGPQSRKGSSIGKLNIASTLSDAARPSNPSPLHMSDGEGTAGEMSDGAGGKRKIKLKLNHRGSPTGSRAASPGGSRSGTPGAPPPQQSQGSRITPEDILKGVNAGEKLGIKQLAARFNVGTKPGQIPVSDFVRTVSKTLKRNKDSNTFSLPEIPS